MRKTILRGSLTILVAFCSSSAFGAIINETETNGTATNNTLATAQAIAPSAFTLPVGSTVFNPPGYATATIQGQNGSNDVDFFSFVSSGGQVYFDIDNTPATFDPIIALFNSGGTLLGWSDDSPADPGSASTLDSFLGVFTLPSAGIYYLAVSENANFPTTALTGTETPLVRPDGGFGGFAVSGVSAVSTYDFSGSQPGGAAYTLNASVQTESTIPEPGSMLLMGAGLVTASAVLRRSGHSSK
jgi:hypothetical protein